MKVIYLTKKKLFLIWIILGIILLLSVVIGFKQPTLKDAFSSPVDRKVIVIDPGHGGFDPGAVSKSGTREDILNLKVSKKLKQYLEEHNATVVLTREIDEGLASRKREDMQQRVKIIRESNPDIVVTVHMNMFQQAKYFGGQTFYMTGSEEGKKLAFNIQTQLVENLIQGNTRKIKDLNNMLILKAGDAPTVLVECGFLSNATEEALLKTDEYQDKIAWSIFKGILDYFAEEDDNERISPLKELNFAEI